MNVRTVTALPEARWKGLSYRKNGDGAGPALIFIHGAVGDSRIFRYQLKHFSSRYKTIALDLPGHGHSRGERLPEIDDFVDAIEDVVKAEGIDSYVLAGHSMGGGVCLEAWKRGIPGIRAMILISTSPVLPVSQELEDIVRRDDMDSLAELVVGSVFSSRIELLIGFAKKGLYEIAGDIIRRDVAICRMMDYREILERIDVPVLVVANSGDAVIGVDRTTELAEGIANASMVVFEAAGHVPFFEQHRDFNRVLDAFLEDLD